MALLLTTNAARADIFTASDSTRSAEADFSLSGGTLTITLTNTYSGTTPDPTHVLTALFFDISGHTLPTTGATAYTNIGSTIINTSANYTQYQTLSNIPQTGSGPNVQYNVGGEWEYLSGLSGAPGSAHQGISSSGFGLFGSPNLNGVDLQNPSAVDGVQYGIVSAGGTAGGNSAVTSQNALIQNSAVFTFTNTGLTSLTGLINNVSFQYGTALSDVNLTPTPEPSTVALATLGALGFLAYGMRRKLAK